MDDLHLCPFQHFQSGPWLSDNERLYAMETRLLLERFLSRAGLKSGMLD